MNITVDLTTVVNTVAWIGIAFLFVFWLIVSRKMIGFALAVAGSVTILVGVYGSHIPSRLIGIGIATLVIVGLLFASGMVTRARRRRVRMYRPSRSQQRANAAALAAQVEREAPAIPAYPSARPAQKRARPRSGYVVNPRKQTSRARAASLK